MDESSIYKVITLKELIAQFFTVRTGFPSKACISKAKELHWSVWILAIIFVFYLFFGL